MISTAGSIVGVNGMTAGGLVTQTSSGMGAPGLTSTGGVVGETPLPVFEKKPCLRHELKAAPSTADKV